MPPLRLLSLVFALVAFFASDGFAEPALKVAATADSLRFSWTPQPGPIEVREMPLHTTAKIESDSRVVWSGDGESKTAEIPRVDEGRDRLFASYLLFDPAAKQAIGVPQFVTDFSAVPVRTGILERPKNKKGLACVTNDDDLDALGAAWAAQNIDVGSLVDWQSPEPKMSFEFQGKRIGLRSNVVEYLDRSLTSKTQRGIATIGVLLNYVWRRTPADSPMIHPSTNPDTVPMGPAAFNTATPDGMFLYTAIVHWLIDRYTQPDAAHGRLTGLVIGNELQSHWAWYHLGEADENYVMDEYSAALRVADLCSRSIHRDFRIFISLEHHWTLRGHTEDVLREIPGVVLMKGINERAKQHGDFPWNLAFHPYPENLFEPRFWNDKTAPMRLDAPRITFRNLEALTAFLYQPEYLWAGAPRHIALTEQGFHCAKDADGETFQAAAYAYAWKRINAIPEIDCFIYHRHVDHPFEGGLHLGLRECNHGDGNAMGQKRMIWDVFQKAGTPEEDAAFAFALPIVGLKDWSHVVSAQIDTSPAPVETDPPDVVFDFAAHRAKAKVENTMSLEFRRVMKGAGWLANGLQQHPTAEGISRSTWEVSLPVVEPGKGLALTFTALLNNRKSTGAGFDIRIDEEVRWKKELQGGDAEPGEVDISNLAGKTVKVCFEVDALGDASNDWTTWVQPRIIRKP